MVAQAAIDIIARDKASSALGKAAASINKVTKGLDETSAAAEGAESAVEKFGDKLDKAAVGAGALAGGGIIAGFTGALDSQNAMAKFQAAVGDAAWSDAAGKAAGELYNNAYGGSLEDTADAVRAVFSGGLLKDDATQAQIESLTGKALSLADTFGQDVGPLARAAGQMIKTGLADNADEAFDIITRGFQTGVDASGDLLDTITEYGTQFRKVGINGETAFGLVSQAMQAGARDGDIAADAIKEFSLRSLESIETMDSKGRPQLTAIGQAYLNLGYTTDGAYAAQAKLAKGGDGARAVFTKIAGAIGDIDDPLTRTTTATALFGTQAEDLGDALYAFDATTAADQLGNLEGAAAKVDTIMGSTASGSMTSMTRQLRDELSDAVAVVLPMVITLTGAIREHKDLVVPLVVVLGGFAAAVWVVNAATTAWAAAQAAITAVTGAWTAAQAALNFVMALNPFVLVAIAIAALVAGIVIAYKKSDTFRAIVQAAFGAVSSAANAMWGATKKVFGFLTTIFMNFTGPGLLIKHFDSIVDFIKDVPGKITSAAKGMFDGIVGAFRAAINLVIGGWNALQFSIPGFKIGPVGFDGFTLGVPDIPYLAKGGIVTSPTLAMIGEAGPEAVVPLGRGGGFGGGAGPTFIINGALDPGAVARQINTVLRQYQQSGGRLDFLVAQRG